MNKKKTATITIMIVGLVAVMIGVASYAYWQLTKKQASPNDMVSACLNFEMVGTSDAITLPSAWPTSDAEGQKHAGYTFTVENKCEEAVNYTISLESLESLEGGNNNCLNYDNIRLSLDGKDVITYGDLTTIDNVVLAEDTETIRETKEITTSTVEGNDTNTHNIKLWLADNAPIEEQNKSFRSRIRITGGQGIENNTAIVLATGDISKTEECSTNADGSDENYGVTTCVPVTGNNVKYTLYDNNELVISGTGEAKDFVGTEQFDGTNVATFSYQLVLDYITSSNIFEETEKSFTNTNSTLMGYVSALAFGRTVEEINSRLNYLDGDSSLGKYTDIADLFDVSLSDADKLIFESIINKLVENKIIGNKYRLIIKDGVTVLGNYTFELSSLESIDLGNIIILGEGSFGSVDVESTITLSDYLTTIESEAFGAMCANNADLILPNSVIQISNSFGGATVNTLKLSNNPKLSSDDNERFHLGLKSVKKLYIPESVIYVEHWPHNPSEVTLYMYGPERMMPFHGGGNMDLTEFKEVIWNYTD